MNFELWITNGNNFELKLLEFIRRIRTLLPETFRESRKNTKPIKNLFIRELFFCIILTFTYQLAPPIISISPQYFHDLIISIKKNSQT